jgi:hypothetical protein
MTTKNRKNCWKKMKNFSIDETFLKRMRTQTKYHYKKNAEIMLFGKKKNVIFVP